MRKHLVWKIKGEVARFIKMTFSSSFYCCEFNAHGSVNLKLMNVFVSALRIEVTRKVFWLICNGIYSLNLLSLLFKRQENSDTLLGCFVLLK